MPGATNDEVMMKFPWPHNHTTININCKVSLLLGATSLQLARGVWLHDFFVKPFTKRMTRNRDLKVAIICNIWASPCILHQYWTFCYTVTQVQNHGIIVFDGLLNVFTQYLIRLQGSVTISENHHAMNQYCCK